jgi:HipA-like protein
MRCLKCNLEINQPTITHYGLHVDCFIQWFKISKVAEFISLQRRSGSDQSSNFAPENTSFFHGKFKKYSADLNGQSYILKMRQDDAPELPEVEYLCNQIGKMVGISVAEFYYIDFNGDKTFVTKNFIKPGASPVDLQHIYHFRSDDKHNCEEIIKVIVEKTQSLHDVKMFIKTILFDSLIGNHDRHGRNFGLIVTGKDISLSPIYDNVSYLSLESGNMLKADFNPTGKVSTSVTDEPSMNDYVKELIKLGYKEDVFDFHKNIKIHQLYQLIDESFCSLLMKGAMRTLISKRFTELENELSS